MNASPKQVYSLCPACSACPTVEIYDDGRVAIGEAPNLAVLQREEWNQLVAGIRSGELTDLS
jgi:hypothetical protein